MLGGNAASLLLWARHGCGPGMMHGPAQRGRTMTRRKFQTSADDTLDSGLYFTRLPGPLLLSNTGSTCAGSSRQHEAMQPSEDSLQARQKLAERAVRDTVNCCAKAAFAV